MVVRKVMVGGGAAALLSLGTLIGGVSTGLVGAHSLHQQARQTQAAPTQPSGQTAEPPETPGAPEAAGADGPDTPVMLPAGSVSQDAAKQAAVSYIQSTAPYSSQGLTATQVTVDDEDGTGVYKVEFTGPNNQAVEVTVSAQGKVLTADAGNDGEQAGAEGAKAGADADGSNGPNDQQQGPDSGAPAGQTTPGASTTQPVQ